MYLCLSRELEKKYGNYLFSIQSIKPQLNNCKSFNSNDDDDDQSEEMRNNIMNNNILSLLKINCYMYRCTTAAYDDFICIKLFDTCNTLV